TSTSTIPSPRSELARERRALPYSPMSAFEVDVSHKRRVFEDDFVCRDRACYPFERPPRRNFKLDDRGSRRGRVRGVGEDRRPVDEVCRYDRAAGGERFVAFGREAYALRIRRAALSRRAFVLDFEFLAANRGYEL